MIPLQLFVQRRIISLPTSATAEQAANTMCESSIGCILITDDQNHLEGIITDRDLACIALRMNLSPNNVSLSEIMTPHPLSVEQSDDLEHVVYLMEESGIRRMPVVERLPNQKLRCIGLITLDDLIVSKLIDYDHIARIVRSQIERRNVLRRHPSVKRSKHSQSVERAHLSLNQFYQHIQANTGISEHHLVQVTELILGALVRKLHYTGAAHLINLLPEGLRGRLLELPSGPDQRVTFGSLKAELSSHYALPEKRVLSLLENFFQAITEVLPSEEVQDLYSQLPDEFRNLLPKVGKVRKSHNDAA